MANKAVLKLRLEEPWDWIVPNVGAVEKGTVMKMSGVGIAAPSDGDGDVFAGIARREKITLDGRTRLALFRRGVFDMTCIAGGALTEGGRVAISGNLIRAATEAEHISGKSIGIAREPIAANGTGEVIVGGY